MESKISAWSGASTSPTGGGMRSTIASSRLRHTRSGLGRDPQNVFGRYAEHPFDLFAHAVGIGRGQVDLVDRGHDGEVVLERQVTVGEGLGLDALARVHHEHHAFTRRQRPRHLVPEVDVAGRVDQVDDVVAPTDTDVLGLDRDAPLAFDVHRIEVLGPHVPSVDRPRQLQKSVSEGGLAVVDVRDDRDVAQAREVGHCAILPREATPAPNRLRRNSRTGPERVRLLLFPGSENVFGRISYTVANIASQKKRNRQNEKRRVRNVAVRSELKTRVKKARAAIAAPGDDLTEVVTRAQKRLDKAASQGVLHKNAAARRTSRLMKAAQPRPTGLVAAPSAERDGPAAEPPRADAPRPVRRCRFAIRATAISNATPSGNPDAPLRRMSAWCNSSKTRVNPSDPSARAASKPFFAGKVDPLPPQTWCASSTVLHRVRVEAGELAVTPGQDARAPGAGASASAGSDSSPSSTGAASPARRRRHPPRCGWSAVRTAPRPRRSGRA